eukprot:CAMPEP_0116127852 /NCGR_PEP_ID=MMETSP0329-20121206/7052_1 /TAXON_ID=697910 /ORGANISM="Pseudo-nitzschia arenysensis, Strain B593" /LENGTH=527 /DNA_ID=CAMNT_0003621961 /DNA_START=163 /DNA_END=1746 /DNA_ORIENTATION=+
MARASTTERIFHLVFLSSWVGLLANSCHGFASASFLSSTSAIENPAFSTLLEASTTSSPNTSGWTPKIESLEDRRSLRGKIRDSEIIGTKSFHHVEFYCGDARSAANHFAISLGMSITGTTSQATGNDKCVSYGLESGDNFRLLLTAPYSKARASSDDQGNDSDDYDAPLPMPNYSVEGAHNFFQKHGLAARAVGVEVEDAKAAFDASVANGAIPVLEPSFLPTCPAQLRASSSDNNNNTNDNNNGCCIAEVELYGDVVLRYVSFPKSENGESNGTTNNGDSTKTQPFLPNLAPVEKSTMRESYGIYRIDHAVGNVHDLQETYSRILGFTGFHEFAEFTSEDVGTVDSGLNSVVLASDSEEVLLPINEPTNGRRKSQIQTYLEQNEGPGLQHLALKTKDIFKTVRKMRESQENFFGFELMKRPSDEYYRELPERIGDQLTPEQYEELEELGILADSDEEGILLQLFTKPVGDRPTFFFEIIQRIGCVVSYDEETELTIERPGCGGFGQGNFRELFKSIEDHEKTLKV